MVDYVKCKHNVSQRRACRVVGISDSVYRYQPELHRDDEIIEALQEAVERYPAYGFSKPFKTLKRWDYKWNHQRAHCVYLLLNLNMRQRAKKRLPTRHPMPLCVPDHVNECWSMDFMSDSLQCGRRFSTFHLLDSFNREALAVEVDLSIPTVRVLQILDRVVAWRAYPKKI